MSVLRGDTKPLPGAALHREGQRTPPGPGKRPPAIRPPRPAIPDAASLQQQQQEQEQLAMSSGDHHQRQWPERQLQHRMEHPHGRRADRSGVLRWAVAVVFTVLAVVVLLAAVAVLVVVLVLQPRAPYLAVQSAALDVLVYDQQGVLDDVQLSLGVVATNGNARAVVAFSELELRLSFRDSVIAVLRADRFEVSPRGSLPLGYVARSSEVPLDGAGRTAMETALNRGVVMFEVKGQARTRFKVGGFVTVKYWTRLACQLPFLWPPNGTALHFSCLSLTPKERRKKKKPEGVRESRPLARLDPL